MAFTQYGIDNFNQGVIADQTLLLAEVVNGLTQYNDSVDPMIEKYCDDSIRERKRISQAPKTFQRNAEGGHPESSRAYYRHLTTPLDDWDLNTEFTAKYLMDSLPSDLITEVDASMKGDVEMQNALFYRTGFLPQTVGSIATPYQAGFYNGETDVPPYKNNSFSSAHFHYLGSNTATFTLPVLRAMAQDIREHGYGLTPGSLDLYVNTQSTTDIMSLINSNTTILQAITGQRSKAIDEGAVGTGVVIEGIMIHFDDNVPAGYTEMLANDVKPFTRRQHVDARFRGLMLINPVNGLVLSDINALDFPLTGTVFLRRVGFSVQFLGAGTVRQIVASTSYATPTFRLGN